MTEAVGAISPPSPASTSHEDLPLPSPQDKASRPDPPAAGSVTLYMGLGPL